MSLVSGQSDPQALLDALYEQSVSCAVLVKLEFATQTMRLSNLAYPFTDASGETWDAMGDLVSVQDVTYSDADLAPYRTYTLSVPTEFMDDEDKALFARFPLLIGDKSEFVGQPESVYLQFFDLDDNAIGTPIMIASGRMDTVDMKIDEMSSTLTLTVEGALSRKNVALAGFLTDRDQRLRFPGDLGLQFINEVNSTEVQWTNW